MRAENMSKINLAHTLQEIEQGNLLQQEIADKFGVSRETISNIKTGKSWKHIGEKK